MSWVGYFFLLTIQDSSWFSIASLIYSKLHDFLREKGQKPKIRKKWTFPVVVFFSWRLLGMCLSSCSALKIKGFFLYPCSRVFFVHTRYIQYPLMSRDLYVKIIWFVSDPFVVVFICHITLLRTISVFLTHLNTPLHPFKL